MLDDLCEVLGLSAISIQIADLLDGFASIGQASTDGRKTITNQKPPWHGSHGGFFMPKAKSSPELGL